MRGTLGKAGGRGVCEGTGQGTCSLSKSRRSWCNGECVSEKLQGGPGRGPDNAGVIGRSAAVRKMNWRRPILEAGRCFVYLEHLPGPDGGLSWGSNGDGQLISNPDILKGGIARTQQSWTRRALGEGHEAL